MTLCPITRPSVGLSLRAHGLSAVELRRDWRSGWRTARVRRALERPLPDGLLRPSASELNIADVRKLADEIQMLLDRSGPLPVALSLPDLCARTVLFEFDTLPPKPAECEALIRWKFHKELNVSAESSRLAYLVFRLDPAKPTAGPARVLATAIRRNIIEQYEEVCERAQLIPMRVGLASLALFDLCRPVVEESLTLSPSDDGELGEFFFMSVSDESFALLAVRKGQPTFLRMKNRNGGTSTFASLPEPPADPLQPAAALLPKATLADEIRATLQFYDETHGNPPHSSAGRPLYVAGHTGASVLNPDEAQRLAIKVIMIRPDWFPVFQTREHETAPASSLAAMASLFAA